MIDIIKNDDGFMRTAKLLFLMVLIPALFSTHPFHGTLKAMEPEEEKILGPKLKKIRLTVLTDRENKSVKADKPVDKRLAYLPRKKAERRFQPYVMNASDLYQVEPALIKAIIRAESGYNHKAVSKRGALGLMQLMPRTARAMGVDNTLDPEHNIHGGVKYFSGLLDKFDGKVELALAAYNAGTKKVRKYRGVPPYKATRTYIEKVFLYYRYYKDQLAGKV